MSSPSLKPIIVISATRGDGRNTKIYKSNLSSDSSVSSYIVENNTTGLSAVYNKFLDEPGYAKSIVTFVHDDVSIQDAMFASKLRKAHEEYNIVGLAGGDNAKRTDLTVPPLWHVMSDTKSGIVAHTTESDGAITSVCFGPTPREVNVIDGLFMSFDIEKCRGLVFDEDFDFHLYDLALCQRAKALNLTIGTWPIWVIHDGIGDSFRSKSWEQNATKYHMRYRK